jgi:hypothetical protein
LPFSIITTPVLDNEKKKPRKGDEQESIEKEEETRSQ